MLPLMILLLCLNTLPPQAPLPDQGPEIPTVEPRVPPKPEGDRWEWDERRGYWWRYAQGGGDPRYQYSKGGIVEHTAPLMRSQPIKETPPAPQDDIRPEAPLKEELEAYVPKLREGSKQFGHTDAVRQTQFVFSMGPPPLRPMIGRTPVTDPKWMTPGGLVGIKGWKAEKFRYVPGPVLYSTAVTVVGNRSGSRQSAIKLTREYPDGTRFDEVLRNSKTGRVFEHRVRKKEDGKWSSTTIHDDPEQYPPGYTGLKQACVTCHTTKEAEEGKYAEGLIPGGDTIISAPMDFTTIDRIGGVSFFGGGLPARSSLVSAVAAPTASRPSTTAAWPSASAPTMIRASAGSSRSAPVTRSAPARTTRSSAGCTSGG